MDKLSTIHAQGFSGPGQIRERFVNIKSFDDIRKFDSYSLKEVQIVANLYSRESVQKMIDMLEIIKPTLK